jgi:hypothetical protein
VLAGLADDDERAAAALAASRAEVQAEITRIDGLIADLEARHYADLASGRAIRESAYLASKTTLDGLMAKAEARKAALPAPGDTGGGDDLPQLTAEEYDDLAPGELRELVARLRMEITVGPQRPGTPRNRADLGRVQVTGPR